MENYGKNFVCIRLPHQQIYDPYLFFQNNLDHCPWYENSVLYEVFPMSFLMEQAGGQAFTGKERVCSIWKPLISFNIL